MKELTRRNFLKGSGAAAAATISFSPSLSAVDFAGTKREKILTTTRYGAIYATVVDGKFTKATPYEDDPHPTPMINGLPDRVYSDTRVKYPYVRESFLKKGYKSDGSDRGKEKFVRVSWEKVSELVADELKRVQKNYGPDSIFGGCLGWQSAGAVHMHYNNHKRLLQLSGGFVDKVNTYSTGAIRVILPYVTGSASGYYKPSSWHPTIENVDNLVIWGADPYVTNQISKATAAHGFYDYMEKLKKEQKKRKVNIININPVYTETAQKLNADHISIVPGTDMAMMLAIANYMYKNDLYDKDFMKKYTVGSRKFFKYLIGKTDGVDKTPEWAEKITTVPASKMIELAKTFVAGKTTLMGGWAMQRADHGEQIHWMLVTLASMIGQIGLPGGGFTFSGHYSNLGAPAHNAPGLSSFPKKFKPEVEAKLPWVNKKGKYIPVSSIARMLLNPGKPYQYNGKNLVYPDIKMVWWAGGNPFHHHQDVSRLIDAWAKPQTVIVSDPYWTATARMADIVLPAATPFERNDLQFLGHGSHQAIVAIKQIIDRVGESRTDIEICAGIADKLGPNYKEYYTEGRDEMAWVKHTYNKALAQAKSKNIPMPDFDTFWKEGIVKFELTEEKLNYISFAKFRADKRKNRLGTDSGKIEIFSKKIEGYKYDDCGPHPTWYEPAEYLGSKKAKKYPFHLVSPHPKYRLHSQLDNTWLRHVYEVQGREPILINPKDAKEKGIKDGDLVKVFNDRGTILAGAVVTNTVRENVVQINEGGWYDPMDIKKGDRTCVHGHVNTLTLDKPTSKLANGNIAHTCLIDFEKFTGVIPPIKAFTPPERI